jgi:uncharacterized protein (TIGR03083 family)
MLDVAYAGARLRVAEVAESLTAEQLAARVPATPDWTVHELLAHLVGGANDAARGRLDGAPGAEWTARHVAERRGRPIPELLQEWQVVGPVVEAGLTGQQYTGPNLAADIICHEADLREALGLGRVDRAHWQRPFLEVMMLRLVAKLRHSATVLICDELDHEWHCGSGTPVTRVRADGYELLRACFGRRSSSQIAAWDWSPAPLSHVIDCFSVFGPREDDQPVPLPVHTLPSDL